MEYKSTRVERGTLIISPPDQLLLRMVEKERGETPTDQKPRGFSSSELMSLTGSSRAPIFKQVSTLLREQLISRGYSRILRKDLHPPERNYFVTDSGLFIADNLRSRVGEYEAAEIKLAEAGAAIHALNEMRKKHKDHNMLRQGPYKTV